MIPMKHRAAIVGAGVSGLTCGVVFAERGYRTAIFAKEIGQQTTSGAAAALWFPYDAEPADKVIPWALETYRTLIDLARNPDSGVSMIELYQFSRTEEIQIPDWAIPLGARTVVPSLRLRSGQGRSSSGHGATWRRPALSEGKRANHLSQDIQEWLLAARSADGHDDLSGLPRKTFCHRWRIKSPRSTHFNETRRSRSAI